MDSEQNGRADAVKEWRAAFDERWRWADPCDHYKYLVRWADKLEGIGAIDLMDRFDMVEMAMSALTHHIEERAQRWLHPASDYDVYNQAGTQVGSVRGNRYFLHPAGVTPGPMDFFAQILEKDGEDRLITRTYKNYGVLVDRYVLTETGQRLGLVETARRFNGQMRQRLDDPDQYRAVVDASIVALEQGDMTAYVELWEREDFSIFRQCSQCCDRFDLREDCTVCSGRGFVENADCPSKLPKVFRAD